MLKKIGGNKAQLCDSSIFWMIESKIQSYKKLIFCLFITYFLTIIKQQNGTSIKICNGSI